VNSFSLDKWIYANRMCEDNLTGIGIYSVPDLVLLKASQKYVDCWDTPFNVIENCLGKRIDELVSDWHGSIMESHWKDILLTGKTLQLKEFMQDIGPKGVTYWDMTVTPLYEDGSIKYLLSNSIDVTDRVLDRIRIENQSKLIAQQNEMLGKSLIEQEEFFSNISHELKTPLNVILSALQVMDLYCPTRCPESKSTKYKRIMKQNCFRLLRLINNLIDMSKIDTGFINLELDNHNIVSVVEDITLSVADFIENKGLTLIFDTDTEEKIIACDPDNIERIILNLLSNSIKFTNTGGEIRVTVLDKEEYVNIVVEDTGIGIPEDKLKLIFERFKQVDKSLKRTHEGSGIGLSLVKSLVELHQGTIEVSSQLGIGSRFSIMLPAKTINSCSIKPQEMISQNNIERITLEFSDIYALGE
jgi:signal transduction histidine kinase